MEVEKDQKFFTIEVKAINYADVIKDYPDTWIKITKAPRD